MGPFKGCLPRNWSCSWMTFVFVDFKSTDYSSVALRRWCWQPSIHSPIASELQWIETDFRSTSFSDWITYHHLSKCYQKHQIFLHSRWFSTSQSDPTNWPLHFSLMVILLTLMAHYRCPWRTGSPNAAQSWHSKRSDVKESLNSVHLNKLYPAQLDKFVIYKQHHIFCRLWDCGR